MKKEYMKLHVKTWRQEEVDAMSSQEFIEKSFQAACLRLGSAVLANKGCAVYWIDNDIEKSEEYKTVTLFVEIFVMDPTADEENKEDWMANKKVVHYTLIS